MILRWQLESGEKRGPAVGCLSCLFMGHFRLYCDLQYLSQLSDPSAPLKKSYRSWRPCKPSMSCTYKKVLCVQFSCLLLYVAKLAKWVVSGNKMLERIIIMSILCAMNFSFILDILFLLVLCHFKLFKLQHSQLYFYAYAYCCDTGSELGWNIKSVYRGELD